jgi:hypothetical protein
MDETLATRLRFLASQLVFVAALIHLGLGTVEWARYASYGYLVPPDYRWPAFVLSGVAILIGLWLANRARRVRPYYLLGILAMLTYVLGYFTWHLTGHRPLLLFGPSTPHRLTIGFVLDHYFAGLFETLSLSVELAAAVLLSILYASDGDSE